jgi:hypothetical protein
MLAGMRLREHAKEGTEKQQVILNGCSHLCRVTVGLSPFSMDIPQLSLGWAVFMAIGCGHSALSTSGNLVQ